jgi:integrase
VKVRGTKTRGSVRDVPLSRRALEALDRSPARLSRILFADERGERIDLYNFRRRVWSPAVESAGIEKPYGALIGGAHAGIVGCLRLERLAI